MDNNPIKYKLDSSQAIREGLLLKNLINSLKLDGCSEYEKIYKINKWISKNIKYKHGIKKWSIYHTAYSALLNHQAVCTGFAYLMTLLINNTGGECYCVTGYVKKQYHSWCIVKLYDKYYYIDPTYNARAGWFSCFLAGKEHNSIYKVDEKYKDIDSKVEKISYNKLKIKEKIGR